MTNNLSSELILGTDFLGEHGAFVDIRSNNAIFLPEKFFPAPEKWVNTALRGNNEVEVANYEIITKWILQHRDRQKRARKATKNI